jgi:hypothetical protein
VNIPPQLFWQAFGPVTLALTLVKKQALLCKELRRWRTKLTQDSNKVKQPPSSYIYLTSENFSTGSTPDQYVDVKIAYSAADWAVHVSDATALGYKPEEYLKKRLKLMVRGRSPTAQIEHATDRRAFIGDYSRFWMPFVKYLIYAHGSVIGVGYIVERLTGNSSNYLVFYWFYLFSLLLALCSLIGFKMKWVIETTEKRVHTNAMIKIELWFARIAEISIWTSLGLFGTTLFMRIVLGLTAAFAS